MWPYNYKMMIDALNAPFDMINSPFAFPRLPPRIRPSMGISSAGKIKDEMVNDAEAMMSRLSSHQKMFQRYASGLFDMSQNFLPPGHPMKNTINPTDLMQENQKLRQENLALKSDLNKERKK